MFQKHYEKTYNPAARVRFFYRHPERRKQTYFLFSPQTDRWMGRQTVERTDRRQHGLTGREMDARTDGKGGVKEGQENVQQ